MEIANRVVVVTGGASGIGAGLAQRFLNEGAKAVVVADLVHEGAPPGTTAIQCDVSREDDIASLVARVLDEHGHIDLFCSNAGVLTPGWDLRETNFERWQRDWQVNVMAHAFAAKAVLPSMIARGEGYLVQTLSAASLLATPESVIYTVTKHAALGLAESLAFTYGRFGIRVSALCPMAVRTPMVAAFDGTGASASLSSRIPASPITTRRRRHIRTNGLRGWPRFRRSSPVRELSLAAIRVSDSQRVRSHPRRVVGRQLRPVRTQGSMMTFPVTSRRSIARKASTARVSG